MRDGKCPRLLFVVPCYNEEEVLPVTVKLFLEELEELIREGKIAADSGILYVDDGSRDYTWSLISSMAQQDSRITGLRLSRNRGHQNALLAGLDEARTRCDVTISMDCDGQDDVRAAGAMVDAYLDGCEIVYGVRSSRRTDTAFKRNTAQGYYRLLALMGVETVYNHADYRLMSARAADELMKFCEVNLFLRGMVPLIGFRSTSVEYERMERMAGSTRYPLKKMLLLAFDGITSFSIRPLRLIAALGLILAAVSFVGVVWAVAEVLLGNTVAGWASLVCIVCFLSGIQLLSLGVIGEYIGKIYMEVKKRPRYIVQERTGEKRME